MNEKLINQKNSINFRVIIIYDNNEKSFMGIIKKYISIILINKKIRKQYSIISLMV